MTIEQQKLVTNACYYVYIYKDKITGEVYYVGQGLNDRAYNVAYRRGEVGELVNLSASRLEILILSKALTKEEALSVEAGALMAMYATGQPLVNKQFPKMELKTPAPSPMNSKSSKLVLTPEEVEKHAADRARRREESAIKRVRRAENKRLSILEARRSLRQADKLEGLSAAKAKRGHQKLVTK